MVAGGNEKARAFFKQRGWSDTSGANVKDKYTSKAAKLYKNHLKKEVGHAAFQLQELIHGHAAADEAAANVTAAGAADGLDALENELLAARPSSASPSPISPSAAMLASSVNADTKQRTVTRAPAKRTVVPGTKKKKPATASSRFAAHHKVVYRSKDHGTAAASDNSSDSTAASTTPNSVDALSPATGAVPAPATDTITRVSLSTGSRSVVRAKKKKGNLLSTRKKASLSTKRITRQSSADDELDNMLADLSVTGAPKKNIVKEPKPEPEPEPVPKKVEKKTRSESSRTDKDRRVLDRFKKNKGITSDQYFEAEALLDGDNGDNYSASSAARFQNSGAISSDAFFGREEQDAGVSVEDLGYQAAQSARKIKQMASNWFDTFRG
jgi:hypothetical protein